MPANPITTGEWQPISSAPRDGERFLAWGPHGHDHMAVFFDEEKPDYPWATPDGISYPLAAFTHWMPLPEPPQ